MPMDECMDLFEYWNEWPPQHILLAARYLDRKRKPTAAEFQQSFSEAASMMDSAPAPLPQHLRDLAMWAEGETATMSRKKKTSVH